MISSCGVLLNFEQQLEIVQRQLVISLESGSRCTVQIKLDSLHESLCNLKSRINPTACSGTTWTINFRGRSLTLIACPSLEFLARIHWKIYPLLNNSNWYSCIIILGPRTLLKINFAHPSSTLWANSSFFLCSISILSSTVPSQTNLWM